MANRNSGHRPGGGAGSRQVKSISDARHRNPRNQGYRPQAVSQIGQSLGNHVTERTGKVRGAVEPAKTRAYDPPVGADTNSKPNVLACGTQAQHGAVAGKPAAQGRDILGAFGPESAASNERRRG